jgi:ribosomal protein S4
VIFRSVHQKKKERKRAQRFFTPNVFDGPLKKVLIQETVFCYLVVRLYLENRYVTAVTL